MFTKELKEVYVCSNCNYISTSLGLAKTHKENCLKNLTKNRRKSKLKDIYQITDLEVLNKELLMFLKEFYSDLYKEDLICITKNIFKSYNSKYSVKLNLDNSLKGILDIRNFKLTEIYNNIKIEESYLESYIIENDLDLYKDRREQISFTITKLSKELNFLNDKLSKIKDNIIYNIVEEKILKDKNG